ncbi:MAG TPA: amidohydrolase family protein [Nitrospirota bacterium]|nr:amidohydrolase family protein [Nitrospirota bacterium]
MRQFSDEKIFHLQNALLMPGLVNTHTHLELPALLHTIRSKTFPDWVLNLIAAKNKIDNKDYSTATLNNINTLIQTGTTTVGEICTHGISPAFLKRSGLRSILYYEKINMKSRETGQVPKRLLPPGSDSVLVQSGLSPHAPYTVSEFILRTIRKAAQKRRIPMAMHIAESKDEIRLLQRKSSGLEKLYQFAGWDLDWAPRGASSFEYLNRIGFLSPNLLAVHAVQVTEKDIAIIQKKKVSVAHCPRSNKVTGVGRMPLKKFLDAGIAVGIGTDSLVSSPTLNMWDEMRYAYRIHRQDGLTPKDIILLGTSGGARAMGMDEQIGSIAPGMKADVIAVSLPAKNTGDLYSDLLRETKSCSMSMVNGKFLYKT